MKHNQFKKGYGDMMFDDNDGGKAIKPDRGAMLKLAAATMPFGKHAGMRLVDLPEPYVIWMSQQGFPKGELGDMLRTVYEIKVNGLEYLFKKIK